MIERIRRAQWLITFLQRTLIVGMLPFVFVPKPWIATYLICYMVVVVSSVMIGCWVLVSLRIK